MHTYRDISTLDATKFEVGYFIHPWLRVGEVSEAGDEWVTLSEHATERAAIKRVNALNGGSGSPYLHQ